MFWEVENVAPHKPARGLMDILGNRTPHQGQQVSNPLNPVGGPVAGEIRQPRPEGSPRARTVGTDSVFHKASLQLSSPPPFLVLGGILF
jgi:hypothetical protein